MILPDVNLLLYAHFNQFPQHQAARVWWDEVQNGQETVGFSWMVLLGFLRISTKRGVVEPAMPLDVAQAYVRKWLAQPRARIVEPGPSHLDSLLALLNKAGTAGNLTTDAHLAALAVEYGATVCSCDVDFARFSGVRWVNPLKVK